MELFDGKWPEWSGLTEGDTVHLKFREENGAFYFFVQRDGAKVRIDHQDISMAEHPVPGQCYIFEAHRHPKQDRMWKLRMIYNTTTQTNYQNSMREVA